MFLRLNWQANCYILCISLVKLIFSISLLLKCIFFLCNTYRMLPDLIVKIGLSKNSNPKPLRQGFHKAQKHEKLKKNDMQGHTQGLVWAHQCYKILDSSIQAIHCDTFKQTWVAHLGIHKVFNSTFLSVSFRLHVWERADEFALKIWLNGWCCFGSVFL